MREKNKKIVKNIILAIIIIAFLLEFSLLFYNLKNKFTMTGFFVLQKEQYQAKLIIGDHLGLDINGTALIFGMITDKGDTSIREVIIRNDFDYPVIATIFLNGNISPYMMISENNFVLKENETKKIKFRVYAPPGSPKGNYSGVVSIVIKKA